MCGAFDLADYFSYITKSYVSFDMRSSQKYPYLFAFLAILLSSCTSYEYIAPAVNAPIFTGKGQFEGSFLIGSNGFSLQLAYAPVNHLGIIASGSFKDSESPDDDTFQKRKSGEFGLGYFLKIKEKFVFEVYGGYGLGSMEGYYNKSVSIDLNIIKPTFHTEDYDKAEYNKYFIQPLFGFSTRIFEGGFTPKFTGVDINIIDENVSQFIVFFEPALIAKVGHKHFKFIGLLGICLPIGLGDDGVAGETFFDYSPLLMSVGINVSLGGNKD